MNYHHFGDIKRWYGVPATAASEFEHAFKTALPEAFEQQPDILVHMDTMISPRILQTYKVPVYALSQVCFPLTRLTSYILPHGSFAYSLFIFCCHR